MICDVAVIGGGPAGATAGRLLAGWGHSVVILNRGEARSPSLAESLPPSCCKLFGYLGILARLDAAGFYRTTGNTVWWGDERTERFAGPPGYQVLRSEFDRHLLELAAAAGARVLEARATAVEPGDAGAQPAVVELGDHGTRLTARYVLDCSGRSGILARRFRRSEPNHSTLAIVGVWQDAASWDLEDPSHTLVEAYSDGWAWSIPVTSTVRYFTIMTDARDSQEGRKGGLEFVYRAELDRTTEFRRLLARGDLQTPPWACDASLYSADRFAGPGFLLVGDAGSFIDPLSSCGVKKAIASAWTAAVVVNTSLKHPAMEEAALEFFTQREHQVYSSYLRMSGRYFAQAAERYPSPFWIRRASSIPAENLWDPDEEELKLDPEVLEAFQQIRNLPSLRLCLGVDTRIEPRPVIEGDEIKFARALVSPTIPAGVRFLGGVNLPRLADLAPEHTQLPDLFEQYNRMSPPVDLANFLGALSVLVAKRILIRGDQQGTHQTLEK